jgi:hypothetical protein
MEISIVKIKRIVEGLIDWVRQDLIDMAAAQTPTLSWLYMEFNDLNSDDTSFYLQLKSLIEKGDNDQRNLLVRLMFDKTRANLPTIHIHYPNEDGRSGDNTLNTGFMGIEVINDQNVNLYSRSFIGQYELIITGGNSLEVVMLYEFLDGLLIAGADTLAAAFDKFEFSGKQLAANQDIIPFLTFYRAIGLSLQRKKIVHSLIRHRRAHDVQFQGLLYINNDDPAHTVELILEASTLNASQGSTIDFIAKVVNGGLYPSYTWYLNGNIIPGSTTNLLSLQFATAGSFEMKCKVVTSFETLNPKPLYSNILTIIIT